MDKVRTILDRALKIIFISALLYIVFPFFKYFLWDIDNFWLSSGNRLPLEKIASIQKIVKITDGEEVVNVYQKQIQGYLQDKYVIDSTRFHYHDLSVWGKLKTKDGLYTCQDYSYIRKDTVDYVYIDCGLPFVADMSSKYYVTFYNYGGRWYDRRRHHFIIKVYERSTLKLIKTIPLNVLIWNKQFGSSPKFFFVTDESLYIHCNTSLTLQNALYNSSFCKINL